jgi:hypothetical protein
MNSSPSRCSVFSHLDTPKLPILQLEKKERKSELGSRNKRVVRTRTREFWKRILKIQNESSENSEHECSENSEESSENSEQESSENLEQESSEK